MIGQALAGPARRVKGAAFANLERREAYRMLGLVGSLTMALRHRQRCRVSRYDGVWRHEWADAVFFNPSVGTRDPAQVREMLADEVTSEMLPRRGDTVVEVGAGIGDYTWVYSRRVGAEGKVVAIEAHPETAACLRATVAENCLANVVVLNVAITDAPGATRITSDVIHEARSVVTDGADGVEVATRTLDDVTAAEGIEDIGLLRMNIEGAEALAIHGMERTIDMVRTAVVSCHDFLANDSEDPRRTRAILTDYLKRRGFVVERRSHDARPWIQDTLMARRGPGEQAGDGID